MVSISTVARMVPRGMPELLLRQKEDVVPQAGFQMALHLRQIEVGPVPLRDQRLGVVEEEQAEIEERRRRWARHRPGQCFSVQVPAARAHHQDGRLLGFSS